MPSFRKRYTISKKNNSVIICFLNDEFCLPYITGNDKKKNATGIYYKYCIFFTLLKRFLFNRVKLLPNRHL